MDMDLLDAIEEPIEQADETAELPGGEQQPDGTQQQPDGEDKGEADQTPVTSLFGSDGKKFDPKVSAVLAKIKAENPEIGKLMMRGLSRVSQLDTEFPGGLTEVRELRDKVEEFGGLDGIQEKLDGVAEMDTLAQQYMAASPAFIDDLIESSPEAFQALAPVVFQRFAEVNPDGFAGYVGRIVLGNMQESGIPLLLMRLADHVGDKPQAAELLGKLNNYLGSWSEMAKKPMPDFKPGAPKPAGKGDSDLAAREEKLRSQEWNGDRTSLQKRIVNTEYTKALGDRKPTSEERAQINELFMVRSGKEADKLFPGWQQKAQRYIKSNDKAGYLKYMEAIYRRVVPGAVSGAVASTMRGKPAGVAPKPGAPAQARPAAAAANGFTPLAKEPNSFDIDYSRTNSTMIRQNQAVLKDGKKVSWT